MARAFRLSSVITVVDATGIEAALAAHPENLRQIAFADHVAVNRGQADVRAVNPSARVHAGDVDPAALMSAGSYSAFGKGDGVQKWLEAETHHDHGGHFYNLNRHDSVVAVPLVRDDPVEGAAFRRFMADLATKAGLLRAKGLVALQDDPSRSALAHAVQHRLYPIQRLGAWPQPLLAMAWGAITKRFP